MVVLVKSSVECFLVKTLFRNSYTANEDGLIALPQVSGKIVAIDVDPGKEVIIQKSAFLASEENVETSVFLIRNFLWYIWW